MNTENAWPAGPERPPVVAGQFYPADARQLQSQVRGFLNQAKGEEKLKPLLVMAPHAGYMYSGAVAGQTLGRALLPQALLLLGPNHTGLGPSLSLWNGGNWSIPGGDAVVHQDLTQALARGVRAFKPDTAAHSHEHSLEVLLPFIAQVAPKARFAAVTVAEHDLKRLMGAAKDVAAVLKGFPEPVAMVVSSDMSHYVSHEQAKARDAMAVQAMLDLDPARLYEVVRRHGISMCGVLPMTLGLALARELGATRSRLAAYATSGQASGDYRRVVGYAGVLVD